MPISTTTRTTAATLALAALMVATLAHAAEKLVVVRDPETGQLRPPTSAEAAALKKIEAKQRSNSRAPVRVGGIETRHADGTVELSLGDDDMMSMVAVRHADGSVTMECLPATQAAQVVRHPKGAAPTKQVQPQKDEAGRDLY